MLGAPISLAFCLFSDSDAAPTEIIVAFLRALILDILWPLRETVRKNLDLLNNSAWKVSNNVIGGTRAPRWKTDDRRQAIMFF